jgi:hypothetical protein
MTVTAVSVQCRDVDGQVSVALSVYGRWDGDCFIRVRRQSLHSATSDAAVDIFTLTGRRNTRAGLIHVFTVT